MRYKHYDSPFTNEGKAALIYLFLHINGKPSSEAVKDYYEVCKVLEISEAERKSAEESVSHLNLDQFEDNTMIVVKKLSSYIGSGKRRYFESDEVFEASEKAQMIWLLINLAYADGEYSWPEKKTIKYLAQYWKMSDIVVKSLEDSAVTLEKLYEQKAYLEDLNTVDKSVILQQVSLVDQWIQLEVSHVEKTMDSAYLLNCIKEET